MNEIALPDEKIRFGEKLSFALMNLGNTPVMALINSFLLIFYTDVVGLNAAAVATVFLLARIVDGISDPIMGYLIDHQPARKLGRFRPILIFGAIVCSLNYLLLWLGPAWAPAGKMVVVYITYLLFGFTFDIMDISLNSMIPVMTSNTKERSSLSSIKGFSYIIGGLLVGVIAPIAIKNAAVPMKGYTVLIIAAVIVISSFSITGTFGVKERVAPVNKEKKYKLRELVKILTQRPVLSLILTTLFAAVASTINSTINAFFFTYVIKDLALMGLASMLMLAGTLPGIFLSSRLALKISRKTIYIIAMIVNIASYLLRMINPTSITLVYIGNVILGVGMGLWLSQLYAVNADSTDFIEYKTGHRAEAAIASTSSFISKVGMGVGGAIPGYLLAMVGYVGNTDPTPAVNNMIIMIALLVPVIFYAVATVIFAFGYNLVNKNMKEILDTLKERRLTASISESGVDQEK